jgi:hypothetical protein
LNDAYQHYGVKSKSMIENGESIKDTSKARKALDDHVVVSSQSGAIFLRLIDPSVCLYGN